MSFADVFRFCNCKILNSSLTNQVKVINIVRKRQKIPAYGMFYYFHYVCYLCEDKSSDIGNICCNLQMPFK